MERSLVLVKPDGVQRGLVGEVIARLERRGLLLAGAKFMQVSRALAEEHYGIHKGKPFYEGLIAYITSAPVMAMVWEGPNAVAAIRPDDGRHPPAGSRAGHDPSRLRTGGGPQPDARFGQPRKRRKGSGVVVQTGGTGLLATRRGSVDF